MTRWIVGQSVKFRLLILVGAVTVLFFGFTMAREAPVDALPEFSPTSVEVQTEAPGLAAAEVEQLLTVPLEADLLNGVAWLKTIRSESVPGLSRLTLVFEDGTDPLRARQVVQERITQAKALPNVSKAPIMLEPLSSSSRVLMVGLTPKTMSLIDASILAQWTVKPRLMGVPGVANVSIWGQRDQQLQVQVDPKRLAASDISLAQVLQTAGNSMWVSPLSFLEASTPGTGGFFDGPNQRLGIQHVSPIVSAQDLGKVTVEDTPNRIVKLGDVTQVVRDHQPLIGDAANAASPSLVLVIEKFPGASTLEVTRGLDQAIDDLRPGLGGIDVDTGIFRPATYLDAAWGNLGLWLLIAAILLLLALALVLFSWRTALVAVLSAAVALGGAFILLGLAGATVNIMTVAGLVLAVGLIVDDVLVDLFAVRDRLGDSEKPRAELIVDGLLAARGAVLFPIAITVLVVAPVFFLGGQERAFYQPMALAYVFAVLASTVIALTVTPALAVLLLSRGKLLRRKETALGRWFGGVLAIVLARPRRALVAVLVLVVAGFALSPLLSRDLVPAVADPDLLVQFDGPSGTSLAEMDRVTARATQELNGISGVRNVASQVGRAVLADQVVGTNSSQLWVSLDPGTDHATAVAAVQSAVSGYPGIRADVLTYEKRRATEILTTPSRDVTIRVYGQDPAIISQKAQEVRGLLAGIDGVVQARVATPPQQPTMLVEVNLAAAQHFGIKPGDVRRQAATLVNGTEVGSLYEGQKIFQVVVQGTPDAGHSVSSVQNLLLDAPSGGHVRLGEVATVKIGARPTVIERESVSRIADVTASVSGRSVSSVEQDVQARLKDLAFPLEYHAVLLGDHADSRATLLRVLAVSLAALLGIFLLLQAAFGSWRLGAAAFVALPFALLGGVAAAAIDTGTLSLGAAAGLVLVLGLAARGTVLLVRHFQRLRDDGAEPGPALVLRGTRERIGGLLAPLAATAVFFLPAAFFGPAAGLEIVQPTAVAVLGGLVTAAVLIAFVVPVVYLVFGAGAGGRVSDDALEPEPATVDSGGSSDA